MNRFQYQNTEDLSELVDPLWYLKIYPDVAAAGVDPRQHFIRFGRFENRSPCELLAVHCDHELWSGDEHGALAQLQLLLAATSPEKEFAAWALARWHGSHGRWPETLSVLHHFTSGLLGPSLVAHPGPALLACLALRESGSAVAAGALLAEQWAIHGRHPDLLLEAVSQAKGAEKLPLLNELFRKARLAPVAASAEAVQLDHLATRPTLLAVDLRRRLSFGRQPLVSVIVPAYNAQETIATALHSLRQQTWRNLEIIVVDDASTDATGQRIGEVAAVDERVSLIGHATNQGAYAARNSGMAQARGEFITVHDSDDWSHPEKIERQMRPLLAKPQLQGTLSCLARCTTDLRFFRERMDGGYTHTNLSSLLFRRQVFERLGFWDRVRAGGDSEYNHRMLRVFGAKSTTEVLPGVPLSFGRSLPESLTQTGNTHWRTLYRGVRRDYLESALRWHEEAGDDRNLYLAANPTGRPFPAPKEICRS